MAKFAKLDSENIVISVESVANSDCAGGTYPESESVGISYLTNLTNHSNWKQTDYNRTTGEALYRKNYASIGMLYDSQKDAFIKPQPYASWTLNETTCKWEPPTPIPGEGYYWEEATTSWKHYTEV